MPKIGVPKLTGWMFVVIAGLLLAVVAIIDRGGFATSPAATTATGSTGCQLLVSTDQLNVRAGPSQDTELLTTLGRGDTVDGTSTQTNLYRQLADGTWAVSAFLTPLPGSNCG